MEPIRPGYYRHFKGGDYQVIGVAQQSEGGDAQVVYRALYGDFGLWTRPAANFAQEVEVDGQPRPRFAFVAAQRPARKLSRDGFARARAFLETQARPLERSLFAHHFEGGSSEGVLTELGRFQNEDGGFGHGLEPDRRSPASSVLATTVALQTLCALQVGEQHPLVRGAMGYLRAQYDEARGVWPIIPERADDAPHAPWWEADGLAARFGGYAANPSAEVTGYFYAYPSGTTAEWRAARLETTLAWLDEHGAEMEMHDFLCFRRLSAASNLPADAVAAVQAHLARRARQLVVTEPSRWSGYGLQPLDVAPAPNSPLAASMPEAIALHLDYTVARQGDDGAWHPAWTWGDAFPDAWVEAERQWSGVITLGKLQQLAAYDRIESEN